ncbi:acyl-CoA dehydrogenase family member 11-like isoform X1 [Lytechinus variegatus]|uniref:acyl-CoA dehydrogenase family member 11-like isoform X1 n=1 Tax=Lytechinus variegatus TaxID=7654 RepID=UPI001BB175DA|nr:acyl-CoA dehydrogenase family member 11-like isoform X1 [Lytechinus variegatus]
MYSRIHIPRKWFMNDLSIRKSTTFYSLSSKGKHNVGTSSNSAAAASTSTSTGTQQQSAPEPRGQEFQVPPFKRAQRGNFFQEQPRLGNVYREDAALQSYLNRYISDEAALSPIEDDLDRFGERVGEEIEALGNQCEENPPYVKHYDAWGNRVDELITCEAWKKQKAIAAEEGIVAIPYERKYGSWSRVYQAAKMILYGPSSGLYSCPLAMTDGAAKIFENDSGLSSELQRSAFGHLTSRKPETFWTSGQWMTEKKGGSDVAGGTETLAYPQNDGSFNLHGYKWFSSATDSDMTLTLARIVDDDGQYKEGTRGLSLFYLETHTPEGKLNGIEIHKLKNKLGTRQLPTAELLLDGTKAHLVSEPGYGVSTITPMLTATRYHNASHAVGYMRRMMLNVRDYSFRRKAFGKLIVDWPLHVQTMSRMEVETRGAIALLLECSHLLGKEETKEASEDDLNLLRLLIPVVKLYTGKQAVSIASEGLESIGGQGYIEDTGLPKILRDAQVLSIWEGTTNILSLDVLRSIVKSQGQTMETFLRQVQTRSAPFITASNQDIQSTAKLIGQSCNNLKNFLMEAANQDAGFMELAARDFAYSIARTYTGLLLLEHATWERASVEDIAVAKRWCQMDMCPVSTQHATGTYSMEASSLDYRTVMAGYQQKD